MKKIMFSDTRAFVRVAGSLALLLGLMLGLIAAAPTRSAAAPLGQTIWLRANANNQYVSADQNLPNTQLVANRPSPSGWEMFTVVDAGGGLIALRASNGMYVSADTNVAAYAPLIANRTSIQGWEMYTWTDVGAGQATLRSNNNGKYVSADQNRASYLVADRATAGAWETFTWGTGAGQPTPVPTTPAGWNLVWSDEFNGSGAINTSNWNFDLGGGGFGNGELETYTNSTANVYQDGTGNLVIKAIKNGSSYTSGRIQSSGKRQFSYGKIEMRARLPYGQGIWPAFWMLGSDISTNPWPSCGEIDIMENIGKASEQNIVHGTIHGPGYSGANGIGAAYTGPRFADGFHTFSIEWSANSISWFVDGNLYETRTNASIPAGTQWVYNNKPFFIILNLAVGGGWPGNPDGTTVFPQSYTIDYVRVYQH